MRKINECEVVESKKIGMTLRNGDKSIEFAPEISQQICTEMINLGRQFISEKGRITIEYFKVQANMYYEELNAYIKNQTLKSDERKEMLRMIEKITDQYSSLINETDNVEKQEQLKITYDFFVDKQMQMYMNSLKNDESKERPSKPDLLTGIKRLFSRN